jgi:hypothetical protein
MLRKAGQNRKAQIELPGILLFREFDDFFRGHFTS